MSTLQPRHSRKSLQAKSHIERLLSLSRLENDSVGRDVFINKEPLERPVWARGAYGGQTIAQSLLAAYKTVAPEFVAHSLHCSFLNAADIDLTITYHVERVQDGKRFSTRIVLGRQNQKLIVSATVSFTRDTKSAKSLQHAAPMPSDEIPPGKDQEVIVPSAAGQGGEGQPCECVRSRVKNKGLPQERKLRQWMRARGPIRESLVESADSRLGGSGSLTSQETGHLGDGHHVHVVALAYMSDNYFIGTVSRVHDASRFANPIRPPPRLSQLSMKGADAKAMREYFNWLAEEERRDNGDASIRYDTHIEMMASLDHKIFFHEPRHFRADQWLLAEMESPWAGHERGLVVGRIWSHDGILVATCVQEGVVRIAQTRNDAKL